MTDNKVKGAIIKMFTQLGVNYRIVETTRKETVATSVEAGIVSEHVQYVLDKYYLEYEAEDLVGGAQWRTMMGTTADLQGPDPLAVMLRELRALGWF